MQAKNRQKSRFQAKKTTFTSRRKKISKGKKKVLLKKKRGAIKFRKRSGETSFDLTRLIQKSFGEAKLPKIKSPVGRFSELALDERIQNNLKKKDFRHPTPIQGMTIPAILEGRDVIAIANTGTGKTAAFVLPLLHRTLHNPDQRVLIVAPTRELAEQIHQSIRMFGGGLEVRMALCVGGRSIEEQMRKLKRNPHYVVGTPGRLIDLFKRKALLLHTFENVVLDEVDRMLDLGFLKDIKIILAEIPTKRNIMLFSATLPKTIAEIARQMLHNPLEFVVKPRSTSRNVEQNVVRITKKDNPTEKLHSLLLDPELYRVLIFVRTKKRAEELADELIERGFSADALHGDKTQSARRRALKRFTQDEVSILVCTDVASRGLDIPDVTHVINFDLPETYDDYVHRIGRTGRADKAGTALTFVDADFDK